MNWSIRGFSYNDYKNYSSYPNAWDGTDGSRVEGVRGVRGAGSVNFPGNAGERSGSLDPEQAAKIGGSGQSPASEDAGKVSAAGRIGKLSGTDRTGKAAGTHPIDPDQEKKPGRRSSPEDCETCKKRKYQDGSDECNVSFKSAAHVSPNAAGAAVRAHENMHVRNAYRKATEKNGKVLSATVAIHTAVCPECGRTYVSGGVTRTAIRYGNKDNPYQQDRMAQDHDRMAGANFESGF